MSDYTNEQIMANRRTVIDFLKRPETQKETGILDNGEGGRCCLGHGAYVLGILGTKSDKCIAYGLEENTALAPDELIAMLGLYDQQGGTSHSDVVLRGLENVLDSRRTDTFSPITMLTRLNDNTDYTPQEIGEYLETVIDGGYDTPFKALT